MTTTPARLAGAVIYTACEPRQVREQLHLAGFQVDVDLDAGNTLNKKIRNAQLEQYNFILGVLLACFQYS